MRELLFRLLYLLRFVAFMSACYLALHMVAARLCRPDGKVIAFFRTLTDPLTRPVRALAPAMTEARTRYVALGVLFAIWLLSAWLLAIVGRQLG